MTRPNSYGKAWKFNFCIFIYLEESSQKITAQPLIFDFLNG